METATSPRTSHKSEVLRQQPLDALVATALPRPARMGELNPPGLPETPFREEIGSRLIGLRSTHRSCVSGQCRWPPRHEAITTRSGRRWECRCHVSGGGNGAASIQPRRGGPAYQQGNGWLAWRWRWDLNPRTGFPVTRFRVLRTRVQPRSSASAACSTRLSVAVAELARTTTNETRTETRSGAASRARITELSSSPQLDVAAFTSRVSPEAASWGANCDACPVRTKQVAGELEWYVILVECRSRD